MFSFILIMVLVLLALSAFGWAALRFGAESRPFFDERSANERLGTLS